MTKKRGGDSLSEQDLVHVEVKGKRMDQTRRKKNKERSFWTLKRYKEVQNFGEKEDTRKKIKKKIFWRKKNKDSSFWTLTYQERRTEL